MRATLKKVRIIRVAAEPVKVSREKLCGTVLNNAPGSLLNLSAATV